MTLNEMCELKNEYGSAMVLSEASPHLHDDPYSDHKYELTYNGIKVGSELVSADFVRKYIEDHKDVCYKTWYGVQTCFYDDGHAIGHIIDTFKGEKPQDTFIHTGRCDVFIDWVDNLDTANSMVEAARSC